MSAQKRSLVRDLQQGLIPPEKFTHIAHVELCFEVFNEDDFILGTQRICEILKNYVASVGAAEKFHLTTTVVASYLVWKKVIEDRDKDFQEFISKNKDIVHKLLPLLQELYSRDQLESSTYRKHYIPPANLPAKHPLMLFASSAPQDKD